MKQSPILIFRLHRGQIKPKADWRSINSLKKRTKKKFFSFLCHEKQERKKNRSFLFGRIYCGHICFQFYLTFVSSKRLGDFFILCGPLRIQMLNIRATINLSMNIDHKFYSPGGTFEPICIKSSTFYFKSMDMLYKAKLYVKRMKESERVPFRKISLFLTHSSLQ